MAAMVRRALFSVALAAMALPGAMAGEMEFISPGIKMGYSFGKGGGFTFGFEVSYVKWMLGQNHHPAGIVFDADYCGKRAKYHLGVEASVYYVGMDAGPTIIVEDATTFLGMGVTPYAGCIWPYLYYTATFFDKRALSEWGGYLKLPISVGGPILGNL